MLRLHFRKTTVAATRECIGDSQAAVLLPKAGAESVLGAGRVGGRYRSPRLCLSTHEAAAMPNKRAVFAIRRSGCTLEIIKTTVFILP